MTITIDAPGSAVSDGYHTIEELYDHRCLLFAALGKAIRAELLLWKGGVRQPSLWRSWKHADGSSYDGWFIAGIELPTGSIIYHIPEKYWNLFNSAFSTLENAPKWDGSGPNETIDRLTLWLARDDYF